ncbi:MAG: MBL fold metallo-hydrolase [Bacteroidales bacterium]|nr:MBL fold metallo-hydrolase [Bacteroidales bacterium]
MGSVGHINIKSFCVNPFRENMYILWDEGRNCVIVDPGCYDSSETDAIMGFIASEGLTPKAIWLTHGHFDHIFGVAELERSFHVPVWMAPEDRFIVERDEYYARGLGLHAPDVSFGTKDLADGQILRFAEDSDSPSFRVIATPGHTPGCVCFYDEEDGILLSGDTLFAGSLGRTDLEGGDYDMEIVGIMEKLMVLPGDVEVFPGHGPATSISVERTSNPFLQPFNEPWENDILSENNDLCI